jgi:hypothetical protein
MCWSFEASLSTFVIGIFGCILLYLRNNHLDRQVAYFMFWILSMQGLEALMWYDKDCKMGINQVASKLSMIQNLVQPLLVGFIFYQFYSNENKKIVKLLQILYLVSTGLFLYYLYPKMLNSNFFCSKPNINNNLEWNWTGPNLSKFWKVFLIVIFLSFLLIKNKGFAYMFAGYFALTLLYSWLLYKNTKAFGCWWCILAVGAPYLKLLNFDKLI